tara:strand:- start:3050 stop:3913 length:864 start_codon:yes stop_codon:yes gene_type:complete
MGKLRKIGKKIKKGVKNVLSKAGKFFDKLGPIGSVALMIAAPYAANAMFGTSFKTVGSMFGKGAGKTAAKTATEEVVKEGIKETVTEGAVQASNKIIGETVVTAPKISSAAGNMANTLLSDTNITSSNLSEAMSATLDAGKAASKTTKLGQTFNVTGGPVKEWFGDVGTALKNHYTGLFTPENLKEGTVNLATGLVEGAVIQGIMGGEDSAMMPRAGIVSPMVNQEQAQTAYMQDIAPMMANATMKSLPSNYNAFSNQSLYSNSSPDFIKAFSMPLFEQNILPLPRV